MSALASLRAVTLDPLAIIAAITAMGALLIAIVRLFATGAILPRSAVPREDYEALRAINATYPEAIKSLVESVTKLAASVDRIAANGGKERT